MSKSVEGDKPKKRGTDRILRCEVCNKKAEEVIAKGAYNGNRDDRFMCHKCFLKVHGIAADEWCK